jgi:hypothetical protein
MTLFLLFVAPSCSRRTDDTAALIPADLWIRVEMDGAPLKPIDAATLSVKPDLEDEHRVAWQLLRLVPEIRQARQLVIEKRDKQRVVLPLGESGQQSANVALVLNRKGEIVMAALDPNNPFPAFHGRGGNRGRAPGEARIRDPYWLRLRSKASGSRDK